MDLRQGCRGQGNCVDLIKNILQRSIKLLPEDILDISPDNRLHLVLEFGELGDVVRGEQVGPRAQHLAKFHEGRAKILKRLSEMKRKRRRFRLGERMEITKPEGLRRELGDRETKSVAREDRQNLPVSLQMPDGTRNRGKIEDRQRSRPSPSTLSGETHEQSRVRFTSNIVASFRSFVKLKGDARPDDGSQETCISSGSTGP